MQLNVFLTLYVISVPLFFLIDMLWLGLIARNFYQQRLGHLLGEINWTVAIIFYLIFLIGLTIFVTYPSVTNFTTYPTVASAYLVTAVLGGLFGFFTYATYDLTNLSTIRDWPLTVALVDIAWGTFLGASVATLTVWLYSFF